MDNEKKAVKRSLKDIGIEKLVFLLVIGIALLILYNAMNGVDKDIEREQPIVQELKNDSEPKDYVEKLEDRISKALSKVEGVGKVEVIISLKSSSEKVINKDKPYSNSVTEEKDAEGGTRRSEAYEYEEATILSNSTQGTNVPFVVKELEPEINGMVIIAEGGGNVTVKNELTKAAEALFNIPVHRIVVMKMESK